MNQQYPNHNPHQPHGYGPQQYRQAPQQGQYPPPQYGPPSSPPPPPAPEKKPRRWGRIVLAVVGGLFVLGLIGSALDGGSEPATSAAPTAPAPAEEPADAVELPSLDATDTVRMEVTGSGKALVTYMKSGGQEQREVTLPWAADVEVDFVSSLTAQKKSGGDSEISCRITSGSEVIADSTSSGPYAVVSCAG